MSFHAQLHTTELRVGKQVGSEDQFRGPRGVNSIVELGELGGTVRLWLGGRIPQLRRNHPTPTSCDGGFTMASLASLPAELRLHISQDLDLASLKQLGSVNSQFREILVPSIFRTIRFTNLKADEVAIGQVIAKYGLHAKKLLFDFNLQSDVASEGQEETEVELGTNLTPVASQLLRGEVLSEISSLVIWFLPQDNFRGKDWGDAGRRGGIHVYESPRLAENLESEEEQWPSWRRAMATMWSLLSHNQTITSLETIELPAMPVSFWLRPEWSAFLARLKTLILSLGGGLMDSWRQAIEMEGYSDFLQKLDVHFFNHVTSVVKLHVIADWQNYYGGRSGWPRETAFRPGQMPLLEELHLEYCVIDEYLCDFLDQASGAGSFLKKVQLIECCGDPSTPSWAQLFGRLSRHGSSLSLAEFVVANEEIVFSSAPQPEASISSGTFTLAQDTSSHRSTPEEDGEKGRPFEYRYWDHRFHLVSHDFQRNREEFENGEDMQEYRKLMQLVEENAKAAKDGHASEKRANETVDVSEVHTELTLRLRHAATDSNERE